MFCFGIWTVFCFGSRVSEYKSLFFCFFNQSLFYCFKSSTLQLRHLVKKIRNCKYFAMKKIIILSGSISYHITVCFQLKSYTVKISNFKSSKDMYYYIKHFFKVSKFKLLSAISFNFMQNYNVSFFNQNNTK